MDQNDTPGGDTLAGSDGGTATAVDFKTVPLNELLAIRHAGFVEWLDQGDIPTWARENIVAYVDALNHRLTGVTPGDAAGDAPG